MSKIIKRKLRNEYVLAAQGMWVRNPTRVGSPYIDINHLISPNEYDLLARNEIQNAQKRYTTIESEGLVRPIVVIVSDGFKFAEKQNLLGKAPKGACIIGTNKSLAKWKSPGTPKRAMNYYLVNNPYEEAKNFLPKGNYFPKCIASSRTDPGFLRAYKGNIYTYCPVPDQSYNGSRNHPGFMLDDYRNPVCAAMSLAHHMSAKKIMLFCCDDSFEENRPGSVALENGLFTYPQQLTSHALVDSIAYWLSQSGVEIVNHSAGPRLENGAYITEDDLEGFFEENVNT